MENISNYSERRKIPTLVMSHILQKKIEQFTNISDYYVFFNKINDVISKIPWAVFHLYQDQLIGSENNSESHIETKILLAHEIFAHWLKNPDVLNWNTYSKIQVVSTPIVSQDGFHITMKSWYTLWFLEIPNYHESIQRSEEKPRIQSKYIQKLVSNTIENALLANELEFRYKDAQLDLLTGLFTRRFWTLEMIKWIDSQIKTWKEIGWVIMLDLDNFKSVNDTYGHLCWDEAIRYVSSLIKEAIFRKEKDFKNSIAIRFWWEELVVYLPWKTSDEAFEFARTLNVAIRENRFQWNGKNMSITASIGVSDFVGIDSTLSSEEMMDLVLDKADIAMYAAKKWGKDQVGYYKRWWEVATNSLVRKR